jgi:hypothetical protein
MFSFDFEFFLADFAHPVMFSFDEGMKVNAVAVIFRAQITFHGVSLASLARAGVRPEYVDCGPVLDEILGLM